jgi:hypothetical protein
MDWASFEVKASKEAQSYFYPWEVTLGLNL